MAIRISGTFGFITNSSSVVYHFPRELMQDPDIQAFITAYGIQDGYVGSEMWNRGQCQSFAVTTEQKAQIQQQMQHGAYGDYQGPGVSVNSDEVVLVYGDEYSDITSELIHLFERVATAAGLSYGGMDYN